MEDIQVLQKPTLHVGLTFHTFLVAWPCVNLQHFVSLRLQLSAAIDRKLAKTRGQRVVGCVDLQM